ncbi:MAG TPA: hypothetical protein VK540_33360 [Polyangiaceae bacterium]|jgi:hypothetical protein|nr:hypothetical protein [Polyangiaceae bacterium]
MKDELWKCAHCNRAVACVFCEACAEHCTAMRPNALEAHRRQRAIVVNTAPERRLE